MLHILLKNYKFCSALIFVNSIFPSAKLQFRLKALRTQSCTKFGANLISSHRAIDVKKAALLSYLQGKSLAGII